MWLVYAFLAVLAYAAADILGKRAVDAGTPWTPIGLFASCSALAFIVALVLFVSGFGESGRAPWAILASEPLILVTTLCFALFWVLSLVSFRYLGLSVDVALVGTSGIVFFIGVLFVNALSGRLVAARAMLHPARFVPILIVLIGAFLLPRLEKSPATRRRTVVGMIILLLAMLLDGVDTLVTAVIFDAGHVGPVDVMTASFFALFPMVAILLTVLRVKGGTWVLPFCGGLGMIVYSVIAILASMLYLAASSRDAVRTGLVLVAEPIFTLIVARIFLNERYTLRQNLCIWAIALAAVAFCVIDQIL